eukprot:m.126097 g.126097  ORF g.126097 m.126097 type:complete len:418 (+) comp11183_c0_seq3:5152-6405(+)
MYAVSSTNARRPTPVRPAINSDPPGVLNFRSTAARHCMVSSTIKSCNAWFSRPYFLSDCSTISTTSWAAVRTRARPHRDAMGVTAVDAAGLNDTKYCMSSGRCTPQSEATTRHSADSKRSRSGPTMTSPNTRYLGHTQTGTIECHANTNHVNVKTVYTRDTTCHDTPHNKPRGKRVQRSMLQGEPHHVMSTPITLAVTSQYDKPTDLRFMNPTLQYIFRLEFVPHEPHTPLGQVPRRKEIMPVFIARKFAVQLRVDGDHGPSQAHNVLRRPPIRPRWHAFRQHWGQVGVVHRLQLVLVRVVEVEDTHHRREARGQRCTTQGRGGRHGCDDRDRLKADPIKFLIIKSIVPGSGTMKEMTHKISGGDGQVQAWSTCETFSNGQWVDSDQLEAQQSHPASPTPKETHGTLGKKDVWMTQA